MSRRIWIIGAAVALLLTGCGSQESEVQEALDFRVGLLQATSCRFTAEASADFGERVFEFTADCVYTPQEGRAELVLTAPESVAGISASAQSDGAALSFDGLRLELGQLANGRIAPLQLPKLLGDAWGGGYIESEAELPDGYLVSYRSGYGDSELLIYTWFNEQLHPTEAEVYYADERVLHAGLSAFAVDETPEPA